MRAWALAGVAAVALVAAPVPAQAAQTSIQTVAVTPSYANPATGVIEDSGGTANQALGESMTASCVFDQALVERAADGRLYATMRFRLIDQISAVSVDVSGDGGATFAAADVQEMQRDVSHGDGSQDNVGDYRFEIPAADAVVRVHLDVVPMGRAVVCFAALGAATEGNPNGFVESVVAGEDIAGSGAAAAGATDAAATGADTAAAGAEAAADASGTEGSGEVSAASDIQEYDADGNRVDDEGPARLGGGTVALVVAAAAGLLAVGAGVFWLVRVRPARAVAARAAAAAAPDSAPVSAGGSGSAAVSAGGSGLVTGPGSAQTGISTGLNPSPEESASAQRPFPPAASSSVPAQDAAPDGVPDADSAPVSASDSELEGSPTESTPSPTGSPTGLTPSPTGSPDGPPTGLTPSPDCRGA